MGSGGLEEGGVVGEGGDCFSVDSEDGGLEAEEDKDATVDVDEEGSEVLRGVVPEADGLEIPEAPSTIMLSVFESVIELKIGPSPPQANGKSGAIVA